MYKRLFDDEVCSVNNIFPRYNFWTALKDEIGQGFLRLFYTRTEAAMLCSSIDKEINFLRRYVLDEPYQVRNDSNLEKMFKQFLYRKKKVLNAIRSVRIVVQRYSFD